MLTDEDLKRIIKLFNFMIKGFNGTQDEYNEAINSLCVHIKTDSIIKSNVKLNEEQATP